MHSQLVYNEHEYIYIYYSNLALSHIIKSNVANAYIIGFEGKMCPLIAIIFCRLTRVTVH